MSTGYWSREQRLARLGPEMYELGLKAAAALPPPTPEQVEQVRRIFAPHVKRLAERDAEQARAERAA